MELARFPLCRSHIIQHIYICFAFVGRDGNNTLEKGGRDRERVFTACFREKKKNRESSITGSLPRGFLIKCKELEEEENVAPDYFQNARGSLLKERRAGDISIRSQARLRCEI